MLGTHGIIGGASEEFAPRRAAVNWDSQRRRRRPVRRRRSRYRCHRWFNGIPRIPHPRVQLLAPFIRSSKEFAPRRAAISWDFNTAWAAGCRPALGRCSEDFAPRRAAPSLDLKAQAASTVVRPSRSFLLVEFFTVLATCQPLTLSTQSIPRIPPRASLSGSQLGLETARSQLRAVSLAPSTRGKDTVPPGPSSTAFLASSRSSASTPARSCPSDSADAARARVASDIPAVVTIPTRSNRLARPRAVTRRRAEPPTRSRCASDLQVAAPLLKRLALRPRLAHARGARYQARRLGVMRHHRHLMDFYCRRPTRSWTQEDGVNTAALVEYDLATCIGTRPRAGTTRLQYYKAIVLTLAQQIAAVGGNPQDALKSGTFKPGNKSDKSGKANTCDDHNDKTGCIFTQNLLVDDATADEINAAVASVGGAASTATASA
uniref:Uncharacterized protein n=1 Tax=Mycena chlorophos TaxID=658473 RepID=A0ABQ0LS51_MYCCL|nr:predicted protein [Mycena chlorophos]